MIAAVTVIMLAIATALVTVLAFILPWWADTLYAMICALWIGVWVADARTP